MTANFQVTVLEYPDSLHSLSPNDMDQLLINNPLEECNVSVDSSLRRVLEVIVSANKTRSQRDLGNYSKPEIMYAQFPNFWQSLLAVLMYAGKFQCQPSLHPLSSPLSSPFSPFSFSIFCLCSSLCSPLLSPLPPLLSTSFLLSLSNPPSILPPFPSLQLSSRILSCTREGGWQCVCSSLHLIVPPTGWSTVYLTSTHFPYCTSH